jgi:antitoxin VapB
MDRLQEINLKHDQLRALLARHQADGLWLRRTRNIAWLTAGADASIPADSETGAYSILVTANKRAVYTTNVEITRLRAEEQFEALGFEYVEFPWHAPQTPSAANLLADEGAVEADLQQLRWVLTEGEKARYRALGQAAAEALEETINGLFPGDTEFDIASRLDAACRKRGGLAVVNLVAADERIAQFRHPLPTMKKFQKLAMVVVCMRRGGLIVAGTRFAHVGPAPDELHEKFHKIAAIDASAMVASQPGRTLGEVFSDLQAAYAAQGEADQWRLHHQGGLIGYIAREHITTPGDMIKLQSGQACAWNPSIVGCKSEDTILLGDIGFEVVTAASPGWPMIEVDVRGQKVKRPGIAVI